MVQKTSPLEPENISRAEEDSGSIIKEKEKEFLAMPDNEDDEIMESNNDENNQQIQDSNTNNENSLPAIPAVMVADETDESDNISTMTSLHSETDQDAEILSSQYFLEEEESLNENLLPEEKERRAKIRKLMAKGDWEGILTKAITFELGDEDNSELSPTSLEKKRSSHDMRRTAKLDHDYPSLDDAMFNRLDSAVHAGDWAAVAQIATAISADSSSSSDSDSDKVGNVDSQSKKR